MILDGTDYAMWLDLPGTTSASTGPDGIEVRPTTDASEYREQGSDRYAEELRHRPVLP